MLDGSLTVAVGDDVVLRFVVENAGDDPIEVTFRDAGKADFAVYRDGEEVWRWSDGKMFAQVLQPAQFEPGEETVFEETWAHPAPGDYTAEATLRVREGDVTARTSFSI